MARGFALTVAAISGAVFRIRIALFLG